MNRRSHRPWVYAALILTIAAGVAVLVRSRTGPVAGTENANSPAKEQDKEPPKPAGDGKKTGPGDPNETIALQSAGVREARQIVRRIEQLFAEEEDSESDWEKRLAESERLVDVLTHSARQDEAVVRYLGQVAKSPGPTAYPGQAAVAVLGRVDSHLARNILGTVIGSPEYDGGIRQRAILSLHQHFRDPLPVFTKGSDYASRDFIAEARDENLLEAVCVAARDARDPFVSNLALQFLARVQGAPDWAPKVDSLILEAIASAPSAHSAARTVAIAADRAARTGSVEFSRRLVQSARQHPSPEVRRKLVACSLELPSEEWAAVEALQDDPAPEVRGAVYQIRIHRSETDDRRLETLQEILRKEREASACIDALESFCRLTGSSERIVELLKINAQKDPRGEVRVFCLKRLESYLPEQSLVAFYAPLLTRDAPPSVSTFVLDRVSQAKRSYPELAQTLESLLETTTERDVLLQVIRSLARHGVSTQIPILERAKARFPSDAQLANEVDASIEAIRKSAR